MIRSLLLSSFIAALIASFALCADLPVAPAPREVRPDGSREPVPTAATPNSNPQETVERIIRNSKAVGDKLAMTDTGSETRQTQEKILKDIQSLIDQQENPPPMSNKNNDMNDQQNDKKDINPDKTGSPDEKKSDSPKKNEKNDPGMSNGGMNDPMPPKKEGQQPNGGMPPGEHNQSNSGMPPPMGQGGGGPDEPRARKPRKQPGGEQAQSEPKQGQVNQASKGNSTSTGGNPKEGGTNGGANNMGKTPPSAPSLPPEEQAIKDVWGYLPDKLRQQAMQYYKQEFMPRYAKLLEHYYLSLSKESMKK